MHELAILKWAAGAIRPLPRIDDIDEDLILESALHHRLEGRLLRRLRLEAQPWAGQTLMDELETRQSANESRAKRQIELIIDIHRDYSLSGQTMISLKGYSPYFLLRDPATLRFSWDMDILIDDASGMQETLSRHGFKWASTGGVEAHHSPRAFRGDLDFSIDTYNYIPVWSYPKETTSADFDPKLNPGIWNQTAQPVHSEIHVADFIEHSLSDLGPEAEPLIVPDPTMAVLIVCAHLFTDFFHGMPGRFGRLPLARFAEICELCKHPEFDRKSFATLVRRSNAFDSVLFSGDLLTSYMGYDPLPSELLSGQPRREWRRYYRTNFWLPAPWSYDDLLMPREAAEPLRNLLNELGANIVVATAYPGERTYWAVKPGKGEPLERVITRNVGAKRLPVEVSLGWGTDAMVVEIEIAGLPDSEDAVFIEFGGFPSGWGVNRDGLVSGEPMSDEPTDDEWWGKLGGYSRVDFSFTDRGYALRVVFPWAVRQDLSRDDRPIPLLLAAVRMVGGPTDRPTPGNSDSATLIPMNVVRR